MKSQSFPLEIKAGSVTVKIYRVIETNRTRFTLSFHEGGLRKLRQFAALSEAKKEAKIIAQQLNAGQGDALKLTGADRNAYLYAVRKLKPLGIGLTPAIDQLVAAHATGAPLVEACKFWASHHTQELPSKTVGEVYAELLEAKKADGCSERYLSDLKSRLGRFASDFQTRIADVTTADIDTWLRALKMAPRTRNNFRGAVQTLFSFAKASGYLSREQTTVAEHVSVARKVTTAITVFSPAEFAKLLAAANDVALPFLVLGGLCGLRTEEILRLKWEDILWDESAIEIRADVAKTRVRRLAPLNQPAAAWLQGWRRKKGPVIPVVRHDYHVLKACDEAGVAWKPNALRHTFISCAMAMTKDVVRVAHECGNSPAIVRSNYDRVVTESQAKLWFSIMPEVSGNVISIAGESA